MKTEWRIFAAITAFLVLASPVYGWWTWLEFGGVEWIGTIALVLSGLLTGMCGWYFWIVSRRIEPRPEDRPDADLSEGAGDVGFFSPGSYWPFGMAASCAVAAIGVALWLWWLIVAGFVAIILTVSGLVFEYYTGTRRIAEQ
ncbi:MAG: cytochrome c oxidase subunit 4 [Micromonosporaceae bacterium]|jgi:hypothetical protein